MAIASRSSSPDFEPRAVFVGASVPGLLVSSDGPGADVASCAGAATPGVCSFGLSGPSTGTAGFAASAAGTGAAEVVTLGAG